MTRVASTDDVSLGAVAQQVITMHPRILVGVLAVLLLACSGATEPPPGDFGPPGSTSGGGGNAGTGGVSNPNTGGVSNPNTGGVSNPNTGGTPDPGTGGRARGGRPGTGGRATGGFNPGTGDTGGTAAGGGGGEVTIVSNCSEASRTLTGNGTGQHCGYTYEYWKDQGTGSLVLKADGFSVDWSNINNLLGRKGIRPGSGNLVATYEANYQPNGNSYLCIYGWTKNPLVEYYIVDSWGSWRPPGGQSKGTVTSDGGSYDIYQTQRVNQPSIEGTKTFPQFWSVRTEKRTSGSITVGNHFSAWAAKGMAMGSFYEVSVTVEGYQSSGKADVRMSIQ